MEKEKAAFTPLPLIVCTLFFLQISLLNIIRLLLLSPIGKLRFSIIQAGYYFFGSGSKSKSYYTSKGR